MKYFFIPVDAVDRQKFGFFFFKNGQYFKASYEHFSLLLLLLLLLLLFCL